MQDRLHRQVVETRFDDAGETGWQAVGFALPIHMPDVTLFDWETVAKIRKNRYMADFRKILRDIEAQAIDEVADDQDICDVVHRAFRRYTLEAVPKGRRPRRIDPGHGRRWRGDDGCATCRVSGVGSAGHDLLDDVAVATHRLPQMLECIESIARRTGVLIGTFGHVADGNLHPTIVYDPTDSEAKDRAMTAFHEILEAALALDGSISGEHGIGSLKPALVATRTGVTEVSLMHGIKRVFDPKGILNPGRAY
jgi:FAD/FMN-containing dehydrogenase